MRENEFLDPFGHLKDLEKAGSTLVSLVTTPFTTTFEGVVEHEVIRFAHIFPDARKYFRFDHIVGFIGDFAMRTELASKALRNNESEARRNKERIDPEVRETLEGVNGGICMDGGKYQMSRDRRFNRKASRFRISDFSDHNNVRILTEETSESIGEVEPDLWVNLGVIYSLYAVFDRIFER